MTYLLNSRKKALEIQEQEGLTQSEAILRFGFSVANITRWNKQIEPKLTRDKPATKLNMDALAQDVKDYLDGYQYKRAARLGVRQ
jgi:transposase